MALNISKELEKTLHIHSEDLPYVDAGDGTEVRILQANLKEGLMSIQLRAQPGVMSQLHKHQNYIVGFTLSGAWGHDHQYLYTPGTYIYETPGVIHQFINGPGVSEVIFIGDPNLDFVDPETLEVTSTFNGQRVLDHYVQKCNEMGITPKFLT